MAVTLQLVDGTGAFNDIGLEDFVRRVQLERYGVSFKVVGIMGAQSSGKSTLLNALFDTSFRVMDASTGRSRTTQGVWLAKAENLTSCTLVMDLEGSDGAERGEDGTLFEKQIALFALAVTDILLINIWYNDIGREIAAGKPLLRAIFDVMRRIFGARKITLMFVIRDMSRQASIEKIESDLRNDLQKIWDEASDSGNHNRSPVQESFDVIVTSLPNYEDRSEEFAEQVTALRMRFENPMEQGGLAADYRRTEPGTVFSHSTKEHWRSIQENRVLDIPTHRFLVAAYRCDEIAKQKLTDLESDIMSLSQEGDANNAIEGFREVVDAKVTRRLDEFMVESENMHEDYRSSKRIDLICEISKVLWPVYFRQIEYHQGQTLNEFTREFDRWILSGRRMRDFLHNAQEAVLHSFDRTCEDSKFAHLQWTPSKGNEVQELKEELSRNIGTYVTRSQNEKLAVLTSSSKVRLEVSLSRSTSDLLAEAGNSQSTSGIWSEIRRKLNSQVQTAILELKLEIHTDFDPTDEEILNFSESLELHGRVTVKTKVTSNRGRALKLMSNKFRENFLRDENGLLRKWAAFDILAIAYAAKLSALGVLSVLSAIRLDEEVAGNNHDSIDVETLSTLVLRPDPSVGRVRRFFNSTSESLQAQHDKAQRDKALVELSSKSQWRNVTESDTVITPSEFKAMWLAFESQISGDIERAREDKENAGWINYKVAGSFVMGAASVAAVALA